MAKNGERGGRRLSAADTQMLEYQGPASSAYSEGSWLLRFDGAAPTIGELRAHVAARLEQLPLLRDRAVYPRFPLARPSWEPDPEFDLDRHVREADPERFAGEEGWLALTDERMGRRLDRRRPLWQLWLAGGEDGEGFVVLFHHSHAVADGHSALHILRTLFGAGRGAPPRARRRRPQGEDEGLGDRLRAGAEAAACVASAIRLAYPPAPAVEPLNPPLGPRRRVLIAELPMEAVMEVSLGLGCFPNDVYLATVAGGLRAWLRERDVDTEELTLRAGVPVKTADRAARQGLGNHFSGVRLPLTVGEADPVALLRRIQAETKQITAGRVARGGALLSRAQNALPRPLLAPMARLEWSPQAINLVVSHLTLPRDLGELLGRPLARLYCWTPLFESQAVSFVAAQGLDATMTVNLLVDPDAVPDAARIVDGVEETLAGLRAAVGEPSLAVRS
jgi:WS/DGAT/MGAT family acyltransferase